MEKVYKPLTTEEKNDNIIFSSQLQPKKSQAPFKKHIVKIGNPYTLETNLSNVILHKVENQREADKIIARLTNDSFFNDFCEYNEIHK